VQSHYDAIIIGGGPAGCAAAAHLARCRWSTAIIDRSMAGSLLAGLGSVAYFPGFPEAISGQELLRRMRRQAELAGAQLLSETASGVSADGGTLKLAAESGKEFTARAIVVATGCGLRASYAPGERELLGNGVYLDAHADGPSAAKKIAAVVGKSRHAAEEALALVRFAERVHFIVPSSKIEADEPLIEAIHKQRTIEMHYSTSLKKVCGEKHVTSITVLTGGQEKEIPLAAVFTYVQEHKPTTGFLANLLSLTHAGAVKVDRQLSTEVAGLFACGDVLSGRPQLPLISASQGVLAGMGADRHLSSAQAEASGGHHAV
jgi:thioredoxin reductase (NADPH)